MKDKNTNNRRNFLKTAGAALVAASVPSVIAGQSNQSRAGSPTNRKQIAVFVCPSDPVSSLPGVFGLASFQMQLFADIGGGGYGILSDPVFSEINSHIRIVSAAQTSNSTYLLRGTVERSQNGELLGKSVVIRTQKPDADGNCNISLTIENTPVTGLLLPAIQRIKTKDETGG